MNKKIFLKECAFSIGISAICFAMFSAILFSENSFSQSTAIKLTVAFCIVCAVSVLFSAYSSKKITKNVANQINELGNNLKNIDRKKIDKEFVPFVDALTNYKKELARVDKLKKQFTANVSHELKTPMTSISGYAEMLESGIVNPNDVQKIGHIIHKESKRLINISNDIIQLSQLEDGDQTRSYETVDLYEIAEDCVAAIGFHAEKKSICLKMDGEHIKIKANKGLLAELIYNLADNAIRYNKAGGNVWISVNDEDDKAVLRVKDDGIGIPEKYRQRIFERFFRVDKSRSKETGGTGLGLAIVKHIVLYHNAEISIDSKLGEGTTFKIVFDKMDKQKNA